MTAWMPAMTALRCSTQRRPSASWSLTLFSVSPASSETLQYRAVRRSRRSLWSRRLAGGRRGMVAAPMVAVMVTLSLYHLTHDSSVRQPDVGEQPAVAVPGLRVAREAHGGARQVPLGERGCLP